MIRLASLRRKRVWVALYALLLALSTIVRLSDGGRVELPERLRAMEAQRVREGTREEAGVRLAYRAEGERGRPVIVLLHGSPGSHADFDALIPGLARDHRVLVPDLPGFGASQRDVPDYSIRAHAEYVIQLLEHEEVGRAHVVGFSMGGGVALHVAQLAPRRVASLTLLASIGVQELELLGSYALNHAVHALQLGLLWSLREATPHFGFLDDALLSVPYARNFYDTDQRPLRGILARYEGPMLILHGERDFLVPPAAAREHARIVPQAALVVRPDAGHFLPFLQGPWVAQQVARFVSASEGGDAPTRADATGARLARAGEPFDPGRLPPASGTMLLLMVVLIALATLVSEDLTCIATGLLIAEGRLGFVAGSLACLAGIVAGDVGLFLAGRLFGRAALSRVPLRWVLTPARVRRSADWFERRGLPIIFLSRFAPGTRLPTYFAAGLVGTRLSTFSLYFLLAAALWTPLLVALSAWLGERALTLVESYEHWGLPIVALFVLALFVLLRVALPALTWRGRRTLVGAWRRWTRWEFWPRWLFYPPVVARILGLGVRRGGPALFTAANPAMPLGGFVGESKSDILRGLQGAGDWLARWCVLPAGEDAAARASRVARFRDEQRVSLPLVVKPDRGERGAGVEIVRDDEALAARLARTREAEIVQEYVPGPEFGVFYARRPSEARGRIISITRKVLPELVGDGRRTLEELIYADPRAVALAGHYLEVNAGRLSEVPEPGRRVRLVELGTHCRGALFLDGRDLLTPALEARIDAISRTFEGFYFGRYDLRAPEEAALREARAFKILELNGVTSEATHIYDPRHGLVDAYRTLFDQWRLAFEIGAENRARGVRPSSVADLLACLLR